MPVRKTAVYERLRGNHGKAELMKRRYSCHQPSCLAEWFRSEVTVQCLRHPDAFLWQSMICNKYPSFVAQHKKTATGNFYIFPGARMKHKLQRAPFKHVRGNLEICYYLLRVSSQSRTYLIPMFCYHFYFIFGKKVGSLLSFQ